LSSDVIKEYLVVLLYFVLLLAQGVGEAAWLQRKGWSTWGKSLLFAWLTNLFGFCVGFAVMFVTLGVTLMLAWDGSMSHLPFKGNEMGVILVLVVLFLPALLMLIKRAMMALLTIGRGRRAWTFALFSSIIFWLLPLGLTFLLAKLLWRVF
jgi:hypothetical protein